MFIYIKKKLELQVEVGVEREGNLVEVLKMKDNDQTSMPFSLLIAFYFVLHTLPLFWPSNQSLQQQQHVLQATLEELVMATSGWIIRCL